MEINKKLYTVKPIINPFLIDNVDFPKLSRCLFFSHTLITYFPQGKKPTFSI